MRRKLYFQTNLVFQLFCVLVLIVSIGMLGASISIFYLLFSESSFTDINLIFGQIIISLVFLIPAIILLILFIKWERNIIILDNEKVYIREDLFSKKRKIQYYTEVKYIEIKSIQIIWSSKKSNGEPSSTNSITGGGAKIPYICLEDYNLNFHYMIIMFMSKKTVRNLIEEIRQIMLKVGNTINIDQTADIIKKLNSKKTSVVNNE